MKKTLYFIFAMCTLAIVSCTNDFEQEINDGKFSFSSISASMGDLPTTRTHLENGGRVVWDINDQIGIFSDTQAEPIQFTCTSVDDSRAVFKSDKEINGQNFFAYYPYEGSDIEGNTLTYTLSSNTQYVANTYFRQSPIIAKSATNDFAFKHTCGIIRFSIRGTQQISSLVLQGNNNEIIAGTGIIDLNTEIPTLSISSNAEDASKSITMTMDNLYLSDTPTDFYFIVPETEFTQGLSLTINYLNDDSSVTPIKKSTTKSVSVSRSVIKSFSAIDTDALLLEQEDERIYAALMAFYNATGGDNWTNNENWGSDKPFSEWYGIIDSRRSETEDAFLLDLCNNNLVGSIPKGSLSNLKELTSLYVNDNKLSSIFISGNNKLDQLWCWNNEIKTLKVYNTSVKEIYCHENLIQQIEVNSNPKLETLNCYDNPITDLKVDSLTNLKGLNCSNCLISALELENNKELIGISCDNNKLTSLDISKSTKLKSLSCSDNTLKILDLSNNKELETISCFRCELEELNVTNLPNLKNLFCGENKLKNLDVTKSPKLETLWCSINNLSSLDITNNPKLYSLTFGNAIYSDGSIMEGNNCISELNTSNNPELSVLFCSANNLTSLDLSINTKLEDFDCNSNNIDTLDISNNRLLKEFYCANNGLSTLNVSNNISLTHIECSKNKLTNLDISNNSFLNFLNCSENNLVNLDVSNNSELQDLWCINNPNLLKIYAKSTQQFEYNKDDIAEIVYVDGGEGPDKPDYYFSTDYTADGNVKILQTATIGKGIDIVMMGDAYSDRLITDGTYERVMNTAMEKFFAEEPYKSYREYFNIYSVTAVSTNEVYEKGASTAFSCYFGDGTHVGGEDKKVFTYAQKAISEDRIDNATIIVIMNSTQYAGTCYLYYPSSGDYGRGDYGRGASISYFPVGVDDVALGQTLQHEACGHGFAKLGDEYDFGGFGMQITECDLFSAKTQETFGWLKNVDFTNDASAVKWNKFLSDSRYDNEGLGVYEGAFTYDKGAYRPSWNSIMRYNTGGFNAPSREAIYYRIHKLAYGEEWEYDYEKFVEYDAINRNATATRTVSDFKQMPPLHEPVIIQDSWKNAKSNIPSRSMTPSNNNTIKQMAPFNGTTPSMKSTISHRVTLPDGRIMIATHDASGKTYVDYENK